MFCAYLLHNSVHFDIYKSVQFGQTHNILQILNTPTPSLPVPLHLHNGYVTVQSRPALRGGGGGWHTYPVGNFVYIIHHVYPPRVSTTW